MLSDFTDDELARHWQTDPAGVEAEADRRDAAQSPFTLLGAALWYAGHGHPVFPVQPGSKVPYPRSQGCKDATTVEHVIRDWWDRFPGSNVAIATGHTVDVIDIDGHLGQISRLTHWQEIAELDILGTVSTPRWGGLHLYVPASGNGNRAGIFPGIDYRGVGGYVVAPPSITEAGTSYEWLGTPRLVG